MADHGGAQDGGSSGGSEGHGGSGSSDDEVQPAGTPQTGSTDDNDSDEGALAELCEMSMVKEGTVVRSAELAISSTGATFRELAIIR